MTKLQPPIIYHPRGGYYGHDNGGDEDAGLAGVFVRLVTGVEPKGLGAEVYNKPKRRKFKCNGRLAANGKGGQSELGEFVESGGWGLWSFGGHKKFCNSMFCL